MRATAIEFRLRTLINTAIIMLGFFAPWSSHRTPLLEWLALQMSRLGIAGFRTATPIVIVTASVIAALGVVLRVWGSAYLGPGTVIHPEMQAGGVIADGPYRYVRNPLYLGLWCMAAAIAFLMPPAGALVAMALLTLFVLRLIFAEEHFLSAQLGEPYRNYLRSVPRL